MESSKSRMQSEPTGWRTGDRRCFGFSPKTICWQNSPMIRLVLQLSPEEPGSNVRYFPQSRLIKMWICLKQTCSQKYPGWTPTTYPGIVARKIPCVKLISVRTFLVLAAQSISVRTFLILAAQTISRPNRSFLHRPVYSQAQHRVKTMSGGRRLPMIPLQTIQN